MKLPNLCMVIPSNFARVDGTVLVDKDFAANTHIYLDHFERVTVLSNSDPIEKADMLASLVELSQSGLDERFEFVELPYPYREDNYLRHRSKARELISRHLDKASVLKVTPHAPFDWPGLAVQVAIEVRVPFAFQADADLWLGARQEISDTGNPLKKLRKKIVFGAFLRRYGEALAKCSVALLHGNDVYEANKDRTPNPHLIHNPSVSASDQISAQALEAKRSKLAARDTLKIVYAGRTEDVKGPLEWLVALAKLRDRGIAFTAEWFGEGTLDQAMREESERLDLSGHVSLKGKVEREVLLESVKAADIFLFCHKFRESPRNLIEALACGTPIVGFSSPYALDLVSSHGGGEFVAVGDVDGLADLLTALAKDRERLSGLVARAAKSGQGFTREHAMGERIALLKKYATIERG